MKNILVTSENGKQLLNLADSYTGEAFVSTSAKPFEFPKEQNTCSFEDGVTSLELDQQQRLFYQVQSADKNYIGAQRRVAIDGLYNCRDLGGYPTKDGKLTKWGVFYRSDAPDHLSSEDVAYLEKMNIYSVIDLRSPKEIALNPDIGINEKQHCNFDPHAEVAKQASATPSKNSNKDQQKVQKLTELAQTKAGQEKLIAMQNQMVLQMKDLVISPNAQKAYTGFMQVLLKEEIPTIFHCQGGKDRTGWAAAIILGLLGVEKSVIYEDYLLTEKYNQPRNAKRMAIYKQYTDDSFVLDYLASLQQTKAAYLDSAFETMETTYGTMENYAEQALQVTSADIEKFKSLYLY